MTSSDVEQAVAKALRDFAAAPDFVDPNSYPPTASTLPPTQTVLRDTPFGRMVKIEVKATSGVNIWRGYLMIDSGASHELQHLWPDSPVPPASVPTALGLAVGEAKGKVYMNNEGVAHAVSNKEFQPLFPINVYVRELDLKWLSGRDRSSLVLPDGRII